MPKKKAPSERAYARLTKHERQAIERMLDRGKGCREIAREIGRAPSTVANEVERHRFVTSPRALRGEPAPAAGELAAACPRLASWPRCCNGCSKRRGYGCSRRPKVFYDARMAQRAADAELSDARRGIDETEPSAAAKLEAIRDGLRRGLSPEQIAATRPELGLAASTIYRWVDAGYAEMTNMELRRKVGYRPRRKSAPAGAGARRAGRTRRSRRFPRTGAPAPGRWTPSWGGRPTRLACSRSTTGRRASSSPCRSRMGRAPRRSPGSGSCARRSARAACAAPSASCSPTTAPSSPTRAGSPRCSARRACSTATRAAPTRRAAARGTTSR